MSDDERAFNTGLSSNAGPHPNPSPSALGEGLSGPQRTLLPTPHSEGRRVGDEGLVGRGLRMRTGNEGERWSEALPAVADRLREIGYDIASPQSGAPPGRSIVARRDLGDRAVVLAIDAGGRFRAEITWVVGEWPSQDEIAGVPVQVVDAVSRAVTVTGQMAEPDQVVAAVAGLRTIAPWASVAESEALPPPT
jgi:hypothetical protein